MAFGVSEPRAVAMTAAEIPIPSLFVGEGLIDTGASCTAVDDMVIQHLGVPPIGTETISTPSSVNHVTNVYDMMVVVLGPEGDHYVELNIRVFSSPLVNQGDLRLTGARHPQQVSAALQRTVWHDESCLLALYAGSLAPSMHSGPSSPRTG